MVFLSSTNLLLTRPFKPGGERGKMVAALHTCILKHMDECQEGAYHPVWKEIRTPTDRLGVAQVGKPGAVANTAAMLDRPGRKTN